MVTQKNVLLVGGLVVLGGLTWFGISSKNAEVNDSPGTTKIVAQDDKQKTDTTGREVITIGHNGRSLVPNQVILEEGKNYDIQVTPTANGVGCMFAATVPTLGSDTWNIKAGEMFTIKVDNAKAGTYPIICTSMGMKHGDIVIQPSAAGVAVPNADEYRLITVEAKRWAYTPSTISIKQGEKVKVKIIDVDTAHGANFEGISTTKDAEGNFIVDTSKTGTYDFSCANFCGEGHREMKGKIVIE